MEFAGWEVPLQYSTIVEEHHAVRRTAGVFDVSHMGKFVIRGKDSFRYLESVLSNSLKKIGDGRALYSLLLNERGTVIDDVIVYQHSPEHFFMIVNAATLAKDFDWFESHLAGDVELSDESAEKTILAVQGPQSEKILTAVFGFEFKDLKPFHFRAFSFQGREVFIGATGYTGERGFEIVSLKEDTPQFYNALFQIGSDLGLKPVGFGARDTLRLESAYHLYGLDMDEETTALEANLGWVCAFDKDFIGKKALLKQKEQGLSKRLTGFELTETGVARHGHEVYLGEKKIGIVTSGTFSPTLQKSIGLAYLPLEFSELGKTFEIMIRDKRVKAKTVKTPFYSRIAN